MSTLAPNFPLPNPDPSRPSRRTLLRAWIPTIIWIGVIACESTSVFTSDHTRGWLFAILGRLGGWVAAHIDTINAVGRKVGHFTGYGMLALFAFFGWTEFLRYRQESCLAAAGKFAQVARTWQIRAAALAVLVTFVVASLDEFHQTLIPGRTGAFRDVLLDTCGGIVAQVIIYLVWKSGRKPRASAPVLSSKLAPES